MLHQVTLLIPHTFVACQSSSKCEGPRQNSERNSIVLCPIKTPPRPSSWKQQRTDCAECLEGFNWINVNCNALYFCKFSKIAPGSIPCAQWCHLYSGVICTVVSCVQWCHLYSGVICTVVSCVQWCHLYSGVMCTVVSSAQWCHVYSGVICTVVSSWIMHILKTAVHMPDPLNWFIMSICSV